MVWNKRIEKKKNCLNLHETKQVENDTKEVKIASNGIENVWNREENFISNWKMKQKQDGSYYSRSWGKFFLVAKKQRLTQFGGSIVKTLI